MHRFFVSPEAVRQQPVALTGEQSHQIRRVLRMRLGERAVLLDNSGWAYDAILVACDENCAKFQTVRRFVATGEPRIHITLYQAVLKGDRFEWALQKGTEVGISRFIPVICERNVVDDMDAIDQKHDRWERIIREAAEQSGRARLPELAPAQFLSRAVQEVPSQAAAGGTLRLIPWEEEQTTHLRDAIAGCNLAGLARIQLYVGPEGGFSAGEVGLAQMYGVQPVTLGTRILRAETAGIVTAAAIMCAAGEI
jgi:16S rRNA (uracil1498-N3)-methyltransferase